MSSASVGLTRVLTEPGIGRQTAPHRLDSNSNPFTYFQRSEIVTAALLEAGIPPDRFSIGPFPIEVPERLPEFWPTDRVCYTTIVDKWNEEKVRVLTDIGYEVQILSVVPSPSIRSGTLIRQSIRSGGNEWENWVPPAVASLIKSKGALLTK